MTFSELFGISWRPGCRGRLLSIVIWRCTMFDIELYAALRQYLANRTISPSLDKVRRKKVTRLADNFVLKDNQLFYTGPSRQYMRLVVLSDEQRRAVLQECHSNPGTGNHNGVRRTRDRVVARYYWTTLKADVTNWVKSCHCCQLKDPVQKEAPVMYPVKVKEAWEVLGMDLIGPLGETPKKNRYVLTMTDLYTKWVVAEPMQTKSASEVSAVLISKLYLFGMVRKIISDQGREFVDQLNSRIFEALNIKHIVSSGYHPQTTGHDEHTSQNIAHALRKYVSEERDDWDVHLQAVVHGINTTAQRSTQYSPYYLLFHRHPRFPEVMNACPMGETFEVQDPEDELDRRLTDIKALNKKVLSNLERVQSQKSKSYSEFKRKQVRQCSQETGDVVLIGENSKKLRVGDSPEDRQDSEFKIQVPPSTSASVSSPVT